MKKENKKQTDEEIAQDFAINMIKKYVKRGDPIKDLKSGQGGRMIPNIAIGNIGGYSQNLKRYNTDYIIINLKNNKEFIFKLKDIYNICKIKKN